LKFLVIRSLMSRPRKKMVGIEMWKVRDHTDALIRTQGWGEASNTGSKTWVMGEGSLVLLWLQK
jgi:hypothetical protein